RAVEMAFADSDVEDYAVGEAHRAHPVKLLDPVWNRTRAVYLSRSALYVPGGATQRYRLRVAVGAQLETELGCLGAPATLRILVDGVPVLERSIAERGVWRSESIDLARFAG